MSRRHLTTVHLAECTFFIQIHIPETEYQSVNASVVMH